ncbi:MAG: tRNA lysidine(34) synthetase TilS, partial [Alphaproteobacteria bacterium]
MDDGTFSGWMQALGPFEAAPRLAVAVSGGPDSLALALLAVRWAATRGGSAVALTVDHGLREESAREAAAAGAVLRRFGLPQHILRWQGGKPATGVQAAARAARYRLMEDWCGANAVLHLLLAHHADDQAETVLLRLGRGSGPFGLAGMAAVRERERVRLLRPLLAVSRRRLAATLRAAGAPWTLDPSNEDPVFARVA